MDEFEIIRKYFAPLSLDGLKDDAAVLQVPEGFDLVVTSDTLNAGTHFMENAAPGDIAHKALRVNLSDLASMGAAPFVYQLNIAYPEKPSEKFLEEFTNALAADQKEFGIVCSGGDTTSIKGPLSVSITAMGLVPRSEAVSRGGAKPGDLISISGPVGDALIGLKILRGELKTDDAQYFIGKYYRPRPRLDLAAKIREYASAAMDISDGLIGDLGHMCDAAMLHITWATFSPQARKLEAAGLITPEELLTGGDDYELIVTFPSGRPLPPGFEAIGSVEKDGKGIRCENTDGRALSFSHKGWAHF